MSHERFQILGVSVSAIDPQKACYLVDNLRQANKGGYVCVAPVSTVISCQDDPMYKNVVNNADIVTPDGMPLVWYAQLKGNRQVKRTYGPELMINVCAQGEGKGYKHYLYGGTEDTLAKLEGNLRHKFSNINIVGKYSPPFRSLSDNETEEVVANINSTQPDIIWVGLGSPKQDFWMNDNYAKLSPAVLCGVGAAFDFIAETKPQAPAWMRNIGLEWFFRLCCEPKRLWKRYLVGNTRFLYLITKSLLLQKTH